MIHKLVLPGDTALYFEDPSRLSTPLSELYAAFRLQRRTEAFLSWLTDEKKLKLLGTSYSKPVDDEFDLPE